VVGNPAHIPIFKSQAKTVAQEHRLFFLGSLHDVIPAYQAADVLAHPTQEDTFAMVVLEAMAQGLPVVVSGERYCGIAALLSHEANALVLEDPRDAQGLSTALARLQQQSDLYRHLSDGALHFARQQQWTALALQQENSYLRVAQPVLPQAESCNPNL
jgi:glycosyltransferase involved in cell wall biosynthesis